MIYISGPITGVKDFKQNFKDAEKVIHKAFPMDQVFNPISIEGDYTWGGYMQLDLSNLFIADKIVFLPGYIKSRGCQIEKLLAEGLGIKMYYLNTNNEVMELKS